MKIKFFLFFLFIVLIAAFYFRNQEAPQFFPLHDPDGEYFLSKENEEYPLYILQYRGPHAAGLIDTDTAGFVRVSIGSTPINLNEFVGKRITIQEGSYKISHRQCIAGTCVPIGGPRVVVDLKAITKVAENQQPINPSPENISPVNSYTSQTGMLKMNFSEPMLVKESINLQDNGAWKKGEIVVTSQIKETDTGNLTIVYGIPAIDGKGGSCMDTAGNSAFKTIAILGQKAEVCDQNLNLFAGYPIHPHTNIEYSFFAHSDEPAEFEYFKSILFSGLEFINP